MTIGIVGGGQLGRMLALAGRRLGLRFVVLEPKADPPAGAAAPVIQAAYDDPDALRQLADRVDVVTYEFENVPVEAARMLEKWVPVRPGPAALELAQDRLTEKRGLRAMGVGTADFEPVAHPEDLLRALEVLGSPVVLKARRLGYDGKGQSIVRGPGDVDGAWEVLGGVPAIAEAFVPFDRELSQVAARGSDGSMAFYPLVENHHQEGILRTTIAPAPDLTPELIDHAQRSVRSLAEHLDYIGVITVELFQIGSDLLANEIAPRVHNSGHWTQDGAVTCQFENQVRAVAGLPLGSADPRPGRTFMTNLIGDEPRLDELLADPRVKVHLYDKSPRPGRKLGHVNRIESEGP